MPGEGGATVGRIIAYFEFQKAQALRDMVTVDEQLVRLQGTARRTSESFTQSSSVMNRANASMGQMTATTRRLQTAQLSVVSAQARLNSVTVAASNAQDKLRASAVAVTQSQEKLAAVQADGAASAEDLTAAETAAAEAMGRYEAMAVSAQGATGRLAASQAGLIRAQERLAAARLPADPGGLIRFRQSAVGAIETLGKLGLGIGVFVVGMKAIEQIKAGAEFQRQMLMIQTNAGASANEVRKMSAAVLGLAGQVGTSPNELVTSLYHVEQNGLRGAKALDVVKIAAQGAQIGNADLEATTNSMTAAVVSGIPGVQNMSQAMGALISIVGTGDMKMSDLNDALGSGILAVSKGYGLSLQDVGAALAVFGDNNIRGANAATALRQTIMAFAKPAASAKKDFADIGLSVSQLGKDMASGGLNKAVQDLNSHMVAAGVTGNKVGAFLTDAFGKKAGVGLSVLMGQVDRFNTKQEEIARGSGSFADKWAASTHTAAFAFKQLGAESEAAGIVVYNKLQPALYAVGKFLGSDLPAAISSTQHALQPLENEIDSVLVPALKIVGGTLKVVASALGDVGSIAAHHTGTIQVLGTVVLGTWAAFKAYTIATAAVRAVGAAVDLLAVKAARGAMAVSAIGSGMGANVASISAGTLALGGIGIALGIAAYAWQKHQAAVAASKEEVASFTSAIQQDSGALGDNTKALAANALQKSGALDAARKAGVSLADLTDASLGNAAATQRVTTQLQGYVTSGNASVPTVMKILAGFSDTSTAVDKATTSYKNTQAAQGKATGVAAEHAAAVKAVATAMIYTVDASGNLVGTQEALTTAADGTTSSLDKQKSAADLLKDSLDALDGVAVSAEDSQNAFLDSLASVTDSVKQNGRSLDQSTTAGRKNRESISASLKLAKEQAQATADQISAQKGVAAGFQAGNTQLARNELLLIGQAEKLGLSTAQAKALVYALGGLSTPKPPVVPKVDTGPASASMAAFRAALKTLPSSIQTTVHINGISTAEYQLQLLARNRTAVVTTVTGGQASSGVHSVGGVQAHADGGTVVGPGGPRADQVIARLSPGEEVINAASAGKHRGLLKAINANKFANGGTVGNFMFNGISYASARAQHNAEVRAAAKPVIGTLNITAGGGSAYGIATYIKGQIPSVKLATKFLSTAVNDAFTLKGVQTKLANLKADLANVQKARADYSGSVTSSLQGKVDITQYGDAGMLNQALGMGTLANQKFTRETKTLAGIKGIPAGLIQTLTQNGPNAGLDTFISETAKQRTQTIAQYNAFQASAGRAGAVAGNAVYGSAITSDQTKIAATQKLNNSLITAVGHLVIAVSSLTGKPTVVELDGKVVGKTIDGRIDAAITELKTLIVQGRRN